MKSSRIGPEARTGIHTLEARREGCEQVGGGTRLNFDTATPLIIELKLKKIHGETDTAPQELPLTMGNAVNEPKQDSQVFEFTVETPFGALPKSRIEVPDVAMRLADIVPLAYMIASELVSLSAKHSERQGGPVRCSSGCSACCRQLVPVSVPEAIFLVEFLLRQPHESRSPVLKRFESMHERIAGGGLHDAIRQSSSDAESDALGRKYFQLQVACPFLVDDNCSIHEIRPIACREHNVTSDPSLCAAWLQSPVKPLRLQRRVSQRLQALCENLTGIQEGCILMPLIFDWYDANREMAARSWPGPQLVSQLLDHILGSPGK